MSEQLRRWRGMRAARGSEAQTWQWEKGRLLGQGQFGDVYEALDLRR